MNKKNAIKALEKQKSKLLDNQIYKDETWVFQTASFIKDFFGKNSMEYSFISQFKFYVKVPSITSSEETRNLLENKNKKAEKFIDDCIDTIRIKGILKQEKINFLNSLTNGILISIMIPIVLTIFGAGFYFGTEKINFDNINLKSKNREMTEKFDSLSQIINRQTQLITSVQNSNKLIKDSLNSALNKIIEYDNFNKKITIDYSKSYSLFNGLALINAKHNYSNIVKISFEGINKIGTELDKIREQTKIEIAQGKRFFIKDNFNQTWIINVLVVSSRQVKIELLKTLPNN